MKLPHLQVTALLIAALCHVPTFAGPTQEPEGAAPPGAAAPGLGRLLTLPKADGPVVVRAAFHLQNINEIDEEDVPVLWSPHPGVAGSSAGF